MTEHYRTIDGNEAAATVAFKTNDVMAIYPITPASPMGELADAWAARGDTNLWGDVPKVVQMQSEAGAAGAVHGALQGGALATTFTASQGLLLMLPNMYKIAGELTSTVIHVAARTVATHALSIFADHSDVMAARATGWAMLFAGSVQEVMDFAAIAQAATLRARVPFLHVFDGFRTSHEVMKIALLDDDTIRALIDERRVRAHRARALSPDHPVLRGTAQNPDVFFQAREAGNPFYLALPDIVRQVMDEFAARTGRRYRLFDYVGHPQAEAVLVLMGSGCGAAEETVATLVRRGQRVGLVKVRLFRPFCAADLAGALPSSVTRIGVLDRTKEPGSAGEPLYQDVLTAACECSAAGVARWQAMPLVVGGRYGLSSKEFTPAMVAGIFAELAADRPRNHFTVGIHDDVTHTSLPYDPAFRPDAEADTELQAIFWGLGSDGTVSANKNSIKIIGEQTAHFAQGYFVYDSRKAGAVTVSHLRFGPRPITSSYQVQRADFVGVHQADFLDRYDVLARARGGATVLINSPHGADLWRYLPRPVQERITSRALQLYVIDAAQVARRAGMGRRINTVMQTCFFALSGVLPRAEALARIKEAIRATYGKRGQAVVEANVRAVDAALDQLRQVPVPAAGDTVAAGGRALRQPVPDTAPEFVRSVTAALIAGHGDELPVSALPVDGTFPTATAQWEKRAIAEQVPVWEPDLCIQCGKCVLVCPHAVIRGKVYAPSELDAAPATFPSAAARWRGLTDRRYTLQVAVEDCTGCRLCVEVCPVKDKSHLGRRAINMAPLAPRQARERQHWEFFHALPEFARGEVPGLHQVKGVQLLKPLFEFSGACAGCGETPYLKLLSQLFGDRALIANATGCSSIYGGNLPTTPWATDPDGRGPAWSNSLFEDNAEFGLGMRLALDARRAGAERLLRRLEARLGAELVRPLLVPESVDEAGLAARRRLVTRLRERLEALAGTWNGADAPAARDLEQVAETLVRRSVWIVGGDGWAYDIGFGGLDHVFASGADLNILVLDTEVYSNTGGQASKATPRGAVAKFAARGKRQDKKDLGLMAMSYGAVYVATVAMGANDRQTVEAFHEAERFRGPSLIIAYSQCIAHGIDLSRGMDQHLLAVNSGHWPLYRYHPDTGVRLDSKAPSIPLRDYRERELRYRLLEQSDPHAAGELLAQAEAAAAGRYRRLAQLAGE